MEHPSLDPQTYARLRAIAGKVLGPGEHTLQATGLLHEAWMRLASREPEYESRSHFYRSAAKAMRHILIDRERSRRAKKRGGPEARRTTLAGLGEAEGHQLDILVLDELIEQLSALDPKAAEVVLLRTFGGLEVNEVAETLDISPSTVKRHWRFAKGWLLNRASQTEG